MFNALLWGRSCFICVFLYWYISYNKSQELGWMLILGKRIAKTAGWAEKVTRGRREEETRRGEETNRGRSQRSGKFSSRVTSISVDFSLLYCRRGCVKWRCTERNRGCWKRDNDRSNETGRLWQTLALCYEILISKAFCLAGYGGRNAEEGNGTVAKGTRRGGETGSQEGNYRSNSRELVWFCQSLNFQFLSCSGKNKCRRNKCRCLNNLGGVRLRRHP